MKKILLLLLFIPFLSKAQTGISGVVTYFFNDNYGNKPDISSQVIIIDSANAPYINLCFYDSLMHGKMYESFYKSKQALIDTYQTSIDWYGQRPRKYKDELEKAKSQQAAAIADQNNDSDSALLYGCYTSQYISTELDKIVSHMNFKLEGDDNTIKRTVDGSGNYSVMLNPGTYFVYIRSKQREGDGVSEGPGMIYYKKVIIKSGQLKDISHNFGLND